MSRFDITLAIFICAFCTFTFVSNTADNDENLGKKYGCNNGTNTCWKLQKDHNANHYNVGSKCFIERTRISESQDKDKKNETEGGVDTGEEIVIDPCMDEENRKFMECVLNYNGGNETAAGRTKNETNDNSTATEKPPGRRKRSDHEAPPPAGAEEGTCQCYKAWPDVEPPRPIYNSSVDPNEAKDWFIWDEEHKECVISHQGICATVEAVTVPYRCANKGACKDLSREDPHYMVCSKGEVKEQEKDSAASLDFSKYLMALFLFYKYYLF